MEWVMEGVGTKSSVPAVKETWHLPTCAVTKVFFIIEIVLSTDLEEMFREDTGDRRAEEKMHFSSKTRLDLSFSLSLSPHRT